MAPPAHTALPQLLRSRDGERLRAYKENLDFFNGLQWPVPTTARTRRGTRQLTFNYAEAFVTKTTAYLMTDLAFVADPVDDTQPALDAAAGAELAIRQVAEQNDLHALQFDTELDCAVLGDAAYKVTWDTAEERVRVTAPDVTALFAWRRPDDVRDVWRVAQRYTLPSADALQLYGLNSIRRDAEVIEEWTADTLTMWLDGAIVSSGPNPYGWIPYVIFPNIRKPKQQWGTSDIPQIRESARALNRVLTQLDQIVELSGNPIAVLEGVTETQDIGVQPGAVWELPEGAKAYLLDLLKSGGVRIVLEYADQVYRTLHDLGESPRSAFGENKAGLSGVALNIELDPIVKKVARKRIIRNTAYAARNDMILALLAKYAGLDQAVATHATRPQWGAVLPNDYTRDVANNIAAVNAALFSRRRAASALGVENPDNELLQWIHEAQRVTAAQPKQAPGVAPPTAQP